MDSASSQRSIWLPPINSHPVFRVIVKATELEPASDPFDPEDDAPTFLHLQLKVAVNFFRDSKLEGEHLKGLDLSIEDEFPLQPDLSTITRNVHTFLLNTRLVQFRLDQVVYLETRFDPNKELLRTSHTRGGLKLSLALFLHQCIQDYTCRGTIMQGYVELEIEKRIYVPEYDAWRSYFEQQTQRYMKEYYFAISRPRTENELMDELMTYSNKARTASRTSIDDALQDIVLLDDDAGESSSCCLVCLQEFSVGSNLKMMPCNHVFHPDCIVQWLEKGSHKCPLCRYELRIA